MNHDKKKEAQSYIIELLARQLRNDEKKRKSKGGRGNLSVGQH